ncbi:MAG TPA: hypothetical protein VJQ43_03490, partial [Thermoplasmata archaeon]|nr:hypothetical protein [Thermoplasmata archaeon]
MARRFGGSAVVVVAVVAFLLTLGLPWVGAPGGASKVTPGTALGPTPATLSRPLAGPLSAPQISCLAVPRSVPCAAGPDRPVVDLISNSSDSGARFQVGVTLPPASADSASVQSSFWVGLWVSGAPCSIDGASYLSITLYPPFSPAVSPASPDWVAQVPVVDLVPSGSCDPLCQNASAQTGIGGVPACEDNIVVGGGWPSSPNVGHFAPGDRLSLSAWGDTNG